jgi:tetratricopeptide (TPR) repeat protein
VPKDLPHLDTSAATSAETYLRASPSGADSSHASHVDEKTTILTPVDLPQKIGRYEIKRLIGSGGMGAVYEAVQDQPRRTVALKVMRSAVASPMALRRFEYESQLLAKLRHPCIAQVYDAGTHQDALTMQSVPYFAMEYVPDARPLTAYANSIDMPLRARLELFLKVCDAVQHGHQRGIIHRDLKPANILVDQQGAAKIIDFGVARSAEPESRAMMTEHTSVGQLVGTLQYMAPEQCGADTTDIDSRADVYALGVVLYELLTNAHPYELAGRSLVEAVRIIREVSPTPPSQRRRELRGDLHTIILKALEKEPARRYESASALAADIQRYLNCETILARRIGVPGRFARWVKRNRAVATVGAVSLVVLIATTVVLATRIINENRRANAELARANDNMSRIKDMFTAMTPNNLERGLVNVEKIFDAAESRLTSAPPAHPATEADFREFLANGYIGLDLPVKAVKQLKRVVALREGLLKAPDPVLAQSLHQLGRALYYTGQYTEAIEVYSRSLEMREKLYGPKHAEVAESLTHLGACRLRQGRLSDAERLFGQALAMRRELLPPGSPDIAASVNNFAKCVLQRGRSEEAEQLFREALATVTKDLGDNDLITSHATHNLAACLLERGKVEEARDKFERALTIRSAKLPPEHAFVIASRLGLDRAKFLLSPDTALIDDALDALTILDAKRSANHPDVAAANALIGWMYSRLGDSKSAQPYLGRALSIYKDPARSTPWELADARAQMAKCLSTLGRVEEAEQLLEQSIESLKTAEAAEKQIASAREELARLYETQGRHDDAERLLHAGQ